MHNFSILAPGIYLYKTDLVQTKNLLENTIVTLNEKWKSATIVNTGNYDIEVSEQRRCFDYPIDCENSDLLLSNLYKETDLWIDGISKHYALDNDIEETKKGPYIYLKYGNNDKFDWHVDDGKRYPRTFSVSAYLNDDYEGGEIEFKNFGISYKPMAGDIIFFSASFPYKHRVKPVTSGTRYAIVNWYRYSTYPLEME
jgi:hypothetical protein